MKHNYLYAVAAVAGLYLLATSMEAQATPGCNHPVFYVQGCQGPAGPQGPQGAMGPQGPKGDTGATGARGAQGQAGQTGATGQTGSRGVAGTNGTNGTNGATGQRGSTGVTGQQGQTGLTGLTGTTGATGATGAAGVDGIDGSYFDDNRLNSGLAAVAAIGMIPDALDGHTAIGMGFTNYRGIEGIAVGVTHKVDNLTLKGAVSTSSGARDGVIGFGASASF